MIPFILNSLSAYATAAPWFPEDAATIFSDLSGGAIPVEYGDAYLYGDLPEIPDAPTNLSAELVESVNVSLSWGSSNEADFYTIYRDGASIATTEELVYSDSELAELTTYSYYVTASNISGESSMSNEVSITTDYEPFDVLAPTELSAAASDSQVDLTWVNPSSPRLIRYRT